MTIGTGSMSRPGRNTTSSGRAPAPVGPPTSISPCTMRQATFAMRCRTPAPGIGVTSIGSRTAAGPGSSASTARLLRANTPGREPHHRLPDRSHQRGDGAADKPGRCLFRPDWRDLRRHDVRRLERFRNRPGDGGARRVLDIAVIQQKYGANTSYHTGNDTYTLPSADQVGTFYRCIWDAGGIDTIRAGATTTSCIIDLRAATLQYEPGGGGWVSYQAGIHGGFTIAKGVVIENAIGGAGDDQITGNAANNVLDGAGGADIMRGGAGNDSYFVDNGGDTVIEAAGQGNDTVFATAHFALSADVENLILQGGANLQGYGNDLVNTLIGNTGNNLLDGRGGADGMTGGAGNDTYFVDNAGDTVIENPNEGTDAVFSTAHFALSANVETLVLQGTADLQGYGNDLANKLYGNAGNNLLDGRGDADLMRGGAGNDSYFVDYAGDTIIENLNEGTDAVFSTAHFGLSANVETLVLQGNADLQGYGNDLANKLYGNAGNNLLDGRAGADIMRGGAGNDTYFVDDAGDQVIEGAGQGTDAVFSTAHFALSANVDTLVLQGNADLQGYGNDLANALYGNTGNNLLNGGTGADI